MKRETEYEINNTEELLTLMNIYLEEWKHRDAMLWKQAFTYFFAILTVMIIPFANLNGFSLGDNLNICLFPIIGLILDVIYAFVCYNYAARLLAVGVAYSRILEMLPSKYQREKLKGKRCIWTMSYFLAIALPICLLIVGVVLFHAALKTK